jgi:hypothetical protein
MAVLMFESFGFVEFFDVFFFSDRLLSAFDDGGVYLSRLSLCALPPLVATSEVSDVLSSIEASYLDHDDCVTAIAQSAQSTHFVSASFDCTYVSIFLFASFCFCLFRYFIELI